MTREEAISVLRNTAWLGTHNEMDEAVQMAAKALEAQDGDCVSRQAVLKCIKESRENIDWGQSEDGDAFLHYSAALYRTIASPECLPSVQPERKKGMWYKPTGMMPPEYIGVYRCSVCGEIAPRDWKRHKQILTNFCQYCGADMKGEQDG